MVVSSVSEEILSQSLKALPGFLLISSQLTRGDMRGAGENRSQAHGRRGNTTDLRWMTYGPSGLVVRRWTIWFGSSQMDHLLVWFTTNLPSCSLGWGTERGPSSLVVHRWTICFGGTQMDHLVVWFAKDLPSISLGHQNLSIQWFSGLVNSMMGNHCKKVQMWSRKKKKKTN